ncbi:MAG: Ig-like domain-containing protein, partial [Nocardioidaceae bacterium]
MRAETGKVVTQAASLLLTVACARMEPPPGGPPDIAAPQLVTIAPDSLARIPDFDGEVEFRFDEVVSEGGQPSQGTGTGDLEKLVILSPTTRVPDVHWRRTRITVRPDEGWQRDRVYRIQLLPGVTDLRRNRSDEGAVVTFTTGAPLPSTTLEGLVVDWGTNRPLAEALVVALLLPDSLPYRALADSAGRFSFGPLPAGEYLVSGVQDENRNLRDDPREPYDTVRVRRGATRVGEIWTFVHDTT